MPLIVILCIGTARGGSDICGGLVYDLAVCGRVPQRLFPFPPCAMSHTTCCAAALVHAYSQNKASPARVADNFPCIASEYAYEQQSSTSGANDALIFAILVVKHALYTNVVRFLPWFIDIFNTGAATEALRNHMHTSVHMLSNILRGLRLADSFDLRYAKRVAVQLFVALPALFMCARKPYRSCGRALTDFSIFSHLIDRLCVQVVLIAVTAL